MLWCFLHLFSIGVHAEIQTQIEPSHIRLNTPFKLILSQENPQNGGVPDLTVLQKDFKIMGTERSLNYSIINGQTQSTSQWIVSLKAKKTGILNIPPIIIGVEQSRPIAINVEANSNADNVSINSSQLQDVMLRAQINEHEFVVNQEITYTVKLYNSKRLLDADYQGPQVQNALIVPLGDVKRYQEIQNNINYVVEEQNYAIFPQKSGPLKIISPTFTALTYDFEPQRIKVQDKPIQINIKPIPKQFDGALWLPAKKVRLSESYENLNQTIAQGSTLTRTVTLVGVGIPAQLLPSLNFLKTDGVSVYPEKGKEQNKVVHGELISRTEINVTYLFNKAGKNIIPELKLRWYNTSTGQEETAVLPPRSLEITPSVASTSQIEKKQSITKNAIKTPLVHTSPEPLLQTYSKWPWVMAFIFALAWLLTLGLWGWQKHSRTSRKGHYKASLRKLNKACAECNPGKARDALMDWARLHWPDAPMLSLSDVTKLTRDSQLRKQLSTLSQVLYKSDQKALWRGDELWRCVHSIKKNGTGVKKKSNPLPPINPF